MKLCRQTYYLFLPYVTSSYSNVVLELAIGRMKALFNDRNNVLMHTTLRYIPDIPYDHV